MDMIITFGLLENTKFYGRQSDYQLLKRVFICDVTTGEFCGALK
jgi:hypothetical protein